MLAGIIRSIFLYSGLKKWGLSCSNCRGEIKTRKKKKRKKKSKKNRGWGGGGFYVVFAGVGA
jgi:hypothetical protein